MFSRIFAFILRVNVKVLRQGLWYGEFVFLLIPGWTNFRPGLWPLVTYGLGSCGERHSMSTDPFTDTIYHALWRIRNANLLILIVIWRVYARMYLFTYTRTAESMLVILRNSNQRKRTDIIRWALFCCHSSKSALLQWSSEVILAPSDIPSRQFSSSSVPRDRVQRWLQLRSLWQT